MLFAVYLAEYDYGYSGYLWHSDNGREDGLNDKKKNVDRGINDSSLSELY